MMGVAGILAVGALCFLCLWLVMSGLRDMLGSDRRPERPNVTHINVRIENSFNGGYSDDRNETETTRAPFSADTYTSNTKRW